MHEHLAIVKVDIGVGNERDHFEQWASVQSHRSEECKRQPLSVQ